MTMRRRITTLAVLTVLAMLATPLPLAAQQNPDRGDGIERLDRALSRPEAQRRAVGILLRAFNGDEDG